jgi:hypothetical protein
MSLPDGSGPTLAQRPPRARAGNRRRARRRPHRVRAGALLACAVAAVLALAFALASIPAVHTVLLQSFTREPSTFTELYFTSAPGFDGDTVVVPVSVNDHGTGAASYRIRVTLESPSGKTVATTTVNLRPRDGSPVPVVARLTTTASVALVRVALLGHPQTLHFSFGSSTSPGPQGTA